MLYRVGHVTVFQNPENPRISWQVLRVSTTVRIGRVQEASGVLTIIPPATSSPRDWLLECLSQIQETPDARPRFGN